MILLCGYGGDGQRVNEIAAKEEIVKICSGKKVAIITNAKPDDKIETMQEVSKFLDCNNIENKLFNLNNKDLSWQKFDVIYFGGGSPLMLMKAIINNNFLLFNWKDKDIIGQSAGAMILFEKFCDEDENGEFKIFKGLNIIKANAVFTPHYNSLNEEYQKRYLDCLKQNNLQTIKLNDCEFLIFE